MQIEILMEEDNIKNNPSQAWQSQNQTQPDKQYVRQVGQPKAAWTEQQTLEITEEDQPALKPAAHAEANFAESLTPTQRWKAETTRPPMMYEQDMAHLAQTAEAPDVIEMPKIDFLGLN